MRAAVLALVAGSVAVAAAVAGVVGCNAVLGIGVANLDPDAGGGATEGGTGDGGVGVARGLTCDYYCAVVNQNCTQSNSEFEGTEDPSAICSTVCAAYDIGHVGTIGPSDDDTLGCRIHYAEQAATDPATNCRFAGLGGGGKCGNDPCQHFCELTLGYCTSPPLPAAACTAALTENCTPYASATECLQDCRGGGGGDGGYVYTVAGSDLQDVGDSLNCRIYHLMNAYGSAGAQSFHCPHTAQVSAVCNGPLSDGGS